MKAPLRTMTLRYLLTSMLPGIAVIVVVSALLSAGNSHPLALPVLILSGTVFIIAVIVDYTVTRKISLYLKEMTASVDAVRIGDVKQRIGLIANDEFGNLALALNALFDSINHSAANEEQLDRMRTEFLAVLAVDLRSSVLDLQGKIGALLGQSADDPAAMCEIAERAIGDVDKINASIDGIFNQLKFESADHHLNYTYFDVNQFVQTAVAENSLFAGKKNISIFFGQPLSISTEVYGDRELLLQVLHHLIENAVTYSPPNSRIELTANENEKNVEISVTDFGEGIAPEHLPKIFDRYFRTANSNGRGIGLSIVKSIMEAHKSFISVRTEPGTGSTFTFGLTK